MRSVQTRPARGRTGAGQRVLTGLAAALVLAALTAPTSPEELGPPTLLRLPVEALCLVAVAVVFPPRLSALRTGIALVGGVLLGLAAAFKLLDIGFVAALNRPFDPLIDWRYAGSLVDLLRDSFGAVLGTTLLVASVLAVLVGYLVHRWTTRGEKSGRGLDVFTGEA